MKKQNKQKHINGERANFLISILPPHRKVFSWAVEGSWLIAVLDSGVTVKVKNT